MFTDVISKIEAAFGNKPFTTKQAIAVVGLADLLKAQALFTRTPIPYIGLEWRLNPVMGCALPLSFTQGQLVKAPVSVLKGYSQEFNYGFLKHVDDENQQAILDVIESDSSNVMMLRAINNKYLCIVKYRDIIDIEGQEWARCAECHTPYPLSQLSDTVVSVCAVCADKEDYPHIRDMVDLHNAGDEYEHYVHFNSGRAYEKFIADKEYWIEYVAKVERAKRPRIGSIAHEDLLDAAKERRNVKAR